MLSNTLRLVPFKVAFFPIWHLYPSKWFHVNPENTGLRVREIHWYGFYVQSPAFCWELVKLPSNKWEPLCFIVSISYCFLIWGPTFSVYISFFTWLLSVLDPLCRSKKQMDCFHGLVLGLYIFLPSVCFYAPVTVLCRPEQSSSIFMLTNDILDGWLSINDISAFNY